jgi:hypothetical protein
VSENLTGKWRGVITCINEHTTMTSKAHLTHIGNSLSGRVDFSVVIPPIFDEDHYFITGTVGAEVHFSAEDYFGKIESVGVVSDKGRKLSGTWRGVNHGTFEWVRDVPNDPAESVEVAQDIKEFAPA